MFEKDIFDVCIISTRSNFRKISQSKYIILIEFINNEIYSILLILIHVP